MKSLVLESNEISVGVAQWPHSGVVSQKVIYSSIWGEGTVYGLPYSFVVILMGLE